MATRPGWSAGMPESEPLQAAEGLVFWVPPHGSEVIRWGWRDHSRGQIGAKFDGKHEYPVILDGRWVDPVRASKSTPAGGVPPTGRPPVMGVKPPIGPGLAVVPTPILCGDSDSGGCAGRRGWGCGEKARGRSAQAAGRGSEGLDPHRPRDPGEGAPVFGRFGVAQTRWEFLDRLWWLPAGGIAVIGCPQGGASPPGRGCAPRVFLDQPPAHSGCKSKWNWPRPTRIEGRGQLGRIGTGFG